jgi:hypothetical protein
MQDRNRIIWLLRERREYMEAVKHSQRAAFNQRTAKAHAAAMARVAELKAIETKLDEAWPEWRQSRVANI